MKGEQNRAKSPETFQVRSRETVRVTSLEVKVGDYVWDDQILLSMETEAGNNIGFASHVYGTVTEIPVTTGNWITPGTILMKIAIDPSPFDDPKRFPR